MRSTLEAIFALALETVVPVIDTRAAITRFRCTMVNDKRTIRISVTIATYALVTNDTINAHLPIGTCHINAVVHIDITDLSLETTWTLAYEFTSRSWYQSAAPIILTGIYRAGIVLAFAIFIHEVFRTVAYVSINSIDAGAAVLAGLRQALIHIDLTIFT